MRGQPGETPRQWTRTRCLSTVAKTACIDSKGEGWNGLKYVIVPKRLVYVVS